MLDLGSNMTVVKDAVGLALPKPDDASGQKSSSKRSPVDATYSPLKGGPAPVSGPVDGEELMLEVTCGQNQAALYMSRLQLGSKGTCVLFENAWLTPNEFQYISGRETAKDWKRSIKHHGKSLKVLISKGILTTSPLRCNCGQCGTTIQGKDKDVPKYFVGDDAKMAAGSIRDVFSGDPVKLAGSDGNKDLSDQRFFRVPVDSHETLNRDGLLETPTKPMVSSLEHCLTGHSHDGARYLASCEKSAYGTPQEPGFRYDRPEGREGYSSHRAGGVGPVTQAENGQEQRKITLDSAEAKLKSKRKSDGGENNEFAKDGLRGQTNGDQWKTRTDGSRNDVSETNLSSTVGQKKSTFASGIRPVTTSSSCAHGGSSNSGTTAHPSSDQSYADCSGNKSSPHDKTKKLATITSPSASSCAMDKPSCGQMNASAPATKGNSVSGAGDSARLPQAGAAESSFMFPSFGSPYYPMIPAASQLPAYYPNPYVWPMPFAGNHSTCSYGWTAPTELGTPNCLRSPAKEQSLDCGAMSNSAAADQAFNFPWMRRPTYPTAIEPAQLQGSGRDESVSSGKRKLDCDPSDYFLPSKHPFYLSDSLRAPAFPDPITWPAYAPTAGALDFRFLPYSLPSYIPDGRTGLFASSFLKGSENPAAAAAGIGLYPGLFPSPCLGVNSR